MNWRARPSISSRSSGCCSGCQPSESSSSRSRPQLMSVSSVCLPFVGERAAALDQTGVDERALCVVESERVDRVGVGERVDVEAGFAVEASEQPDLGRFQVHPCPCGESFEDAVGLLAAREDAELAGELGKRIGVLRNRERLADARGRDGVAQRQLLDEPGERERRNADRCRDEEDDVERVGERLDVGVVDSRGKLRERGGVEVAAAGVRLSRERLRQVVGSAGSRRPPRARMRRRSPRSSGRGSRPRSRRRARCRGRRSGPRARAPASRGRDRGRARTCTARRSRRSCRRPSARAGRARSRSPRCRRSGRPCSGRCA